MKSIDEAGVKWHLLHPDADKEETWKVGANYVLDAIQSCIDRHEDGCLALKAITLTIDELKR